MKNNLEDLPCIGEQWYHYKHSDDRGAEDHLYTIVALGYGTEDDILYVVYEPVYISDHLGEHSASVYVRPLDNFLSNVVLESGEKRKRFVKKEG